MVRFYLNERMPSFNTLFCALEYKQFGSFRIYFEKINRGWKRFLVQGHHGHCVFLLGFFCIEAAGISAWMGHHLAFGSLVRNAHILDLDVLDLVYGDIF